MSEIVFGIAKTLPAFDGDASIGTKVTGQGAFMEILLSVVMDASEDFKIRQVQLLEMPKDAYHTVRSGVRSTEGLTGKDFHSRKHRGEWELFALPPPRLEPFSTLDVLVYTLHAYAQDDEVTNAEVAEHEKENVTHVIVAIHAGASSLSYRRLVTRLAEGERIQNQFTLQNIAMETVAYEQKWKVVADVEPERTYPR